MRPTAAQAELERLESEAAIRKVLNTYSHAADRGDVELMRTVYHPDGIDEHGSWFHGLGWDFAAWVAERKDDWTAMMHHLTTMVILVNGDVAAAETNVIAMHVERVGGRFTWGCGRYLDRFERREGVWKIAYRRYVHDTDLPVPTDARTASEVLERVLGRRDRTDPSYVHFTSRTQT
jgi:hypothetical protein